MWGLSECGWHDSTADDDVGDAIDEEGFCGHTRDRAFFDGGVVEAVGEAGGGIGGRGHWTVGE